jgi:hypothetical protein
VAQNLSDGRYCQAADRPSHFSLAWGGPPFHDEAGNIIKARESGSEGELKTLRNNRGGKTVKTYWSSWMYGASKQTPNELAVLARSWLQPPQLKIKHGDFTNEGYDFTQRAYILSCPDKMLDNLEVELTAGNESPIVNICLIINGWEADNIAVQMNDEVLQEKKDYRIGRRKGLNREDLIIWIEHESLGTSRILISR